MIKLTNLADNQRQPEWQSLCACCPNSTLDIVLDGDLVPSPCGYYGPALHPVHMDWSMVSKHEPSILMTPQDMILESVLWNHR